LQNEKKPCPIDNSSFDTSHLVPNRALCSQIEDIEIYCPNGLSLRASCSENEESSSSKDDSVVDVVVDSNGCPEKMKYCELNQHLLVCHFSLVECPEGGSLCGKLRKKELDRHLAGCTQYSCVNKSYGCIFTGTKADKDKHEMDCPLKEAGLHNAIETLTEEVKSLKTDREDVQEKLSELAKINITSNAKLEEQAVMIKSLIARVEMLEGEIKHMKSLSASSEGSYTPLKRKKESTRVGRGNGGHRLSSSSMVAQSPSGADHNDYWQMPFTLKCIGTFRSVVCMCVYIFVCLFV
jgi:hypothetical protein